MKGVFFLWYIRRGYYDMKCIFMVLDFKSSSSMCILQHASSQIIQREKIWEFKYYDSFGCTCIFLDFVIWIFKGKYFVIWMQYSTDILYLTSFILFVRIPLDLGPNANFGWQIGFCIPIVVPSDGSLGKHIASNFYF